MLLCSALLCCALRAISARACIDSDAMIKGVREISYICMCVCCLYVNSFEVG